MSEWLHQLRLNHEETMLSVVSMEGVIYGVS